MKTLLTEPETCPRCGADFRCSKSGKCWCFEIQLSPRIREAINEKYDSCLCPACLESLARTDGNP